MKKYRILKKTNILQNYKELLDNSEIIGKKLWDSAKLLKKYHIFKKSGAYILDILKYLEQLYRIF